MSDDLRINVDSDSQRSLIVEGSERREPVDYTNYQWLTAA